MYVAGLVLSCPACLNLNPLDKKSNRGVPLPPSVALVSGYKYKPAALYVALDVSYTTQLPVVDDIFNNTYLGLNPVNTNGPSAEPFPV